VIIETLFSTLNEEGIPNFAPMGVVWGEQEVTVRPFRDTATFRNLLSARCGVANLTDDVLLFARAALETVDPPWCPARHIEGAVLAEACSWRELEVIEVKGACADDRADIRCRVAGRGHRREFLGFSRARSAVIEAAIVATRLHLHRREDVEADLARYREVVARTGGEREHEAIAYLEDRVVRWYGARSG
jgi:hypothetical protein